MADISLTPEQQRQLDALPPEQRLQMDALRSRFDRSVDMAKTNPLRLADEVLPEIPVFGGALDNVMDQVEGGIGLVQMTPEQIARMEKGLKDNEELAEKIKNGDIKFDGKDDPNLFTLASFGDTFQNITEEGPEGDAKRAISKAAWTGMLQEQNAVNRLELANSHNLAALNNSQEYVDAYHKLTQHAVANIEAGGMKFSKGQLEAHLRDEAGWMKQRGVKEGDKCYEVYQEMVNLEEAMDKKGVKLDYRKGAAFDREAALDHWREFGKPKAHAKGHGKEKDREHHDDGRGEIAEAKGAGKDEPKDKEGKSEEKGEGKPGEARVPGSRTFTVEKVETGAVAEKEEDKAAGKGKGPEAAEREVAHGEGKAPPSRESTKYIAAEAKGGPSGPTQVAAPMPQQPAQAAGAGRK